MLPRLETCCCGCSLQSGTKIIGWVESIFFFIAVIIYSIFTDFLATATDTDPDIQNAINLLYGIYLTMSIVFAVQTLVSFLIVIASHKENRRLLMPWLIFATVNILLSLVMLIINGVTYSSTANAGSLAVSIIISLATIALKTYFFLVVYNYYARLSESSGGAIPPGFARNVV